MGERRRVLAGRESRRWLHLTRSAELWNSPRRSRGGAAQVMINEVYEFANLEVPDFSPTDLCKQVRKGKRLAIMLLDERSQNDRVNRLKTEVAEQERLGSNFAR